MNYLMKNEKEVNRLARQSKSNSFDVSDELKHISIDSGKSVLEVGCGAGTLISFIEENFNVDASGCDLQEEHVQYCNDNCNKSIKFFQHNILTTDLAEKYDCIFFRYVIHHLGADNFNKCLVRLKKALKPSGKIIVIDVDGLMENIGTLDKQLIEYLEVISNKFTGDTKIGRKIPNLLAQAGFSDIKYDLTTVLFKGNERTEEINQWKERVEFGKKTYIELLGSEMDFNRFKKLYFKELENENIPLFLNKFIIEASM